jgi:hypothetical protein
MYSEKCQAEMKNYIRSPNRSLNLNRYKTNFGIVKGIVVD